MAHMGWFKKENDPPKPGDEGKSDGDLLLEKISAAIDAKLSPINATVGELKTEWDSLKTASRPPEKETPPKDPPARVSVLDDEEAAFQQRLGPLAYQNAVTMARVIESEVFSELREQGLGELLPDVRKYLENTPIQRKAEKDYPGYVRNVAKLVFADKAMAAGVKLGADQKTFYLESGNTRTEPGDQVLSSQLNWADSNGRVHTGDEVAAKLGLSEADAKAIGKEFLQ